MRSALRRLPMTPAAPVRNMSTVLSSLIQVAGAIISDPTYTCLLHNDTHCRLLSVLSITRCAGQRTEIHEINAGNSEVHVVIIPGKRNC